MALLCRIGISAEVHRYLNGVFFAEVNSPGLSLLAPINPPTFVMHGREACFGLLAILWNNDGDESWMLFSSDFRDLLSNDFRGLCFFIATFAFIAFM